METLTQIEEEIRYRDLEALEKYKLGSVPAPVLYSPNFLGLVKRVDDTDASPMTFIASTEAPDRFGDILSAAGWELSQFEKNPVILFSHDHRIMPVARAPKVWVAEKQLLNTVEFDAGDPFALAIKGKYIRGMMRGESVGFKPLEFEEMNGGGILFKKQELLEISLVSVPANPEALRRSLGDTTFSIAMPALVFQIFQNTAPADRVLDREETPAVPVKPVPQPDAGDIELTTIVEALRSIREA